MGSFSIIDGLATVATPGAHARRGSSWESAADLGADIRGLAAALIGYGLAPGARVAVLGDEGLDAIKAQLSVIVAGGCLVVPEAGLGESALAHALAASAISQAIAIDEERLARILALRPDLPTLELLLLMSAKPSERKPAALLARSAMAAGDELLRQQPDLLRTLRSGLQPSDPAIVFWRTAGAPQALSRAALEALADRLENAIQPARDRSVLVALPSESVVRLAAALAIASKDGTLLVADALHRPDAGLKEHGADAALLGVPAAVRLERAWLADLDKRSWIGRVVARWSLRQPPRPERGRWKRNLAEALVLRELRSSLGAVRQLDVVRHKGSSLGHATESFFETVGLPVRYFDGNVSFTAGPAIAP